jgi:hypothetical protein
MLAGFATAISRLLCRQLMSIVLSMLFGPDRSMASTAGLSSPAWSASWTVGFGDACRRVSG